MRLKKAVKYAACGLAGIIGATGVAAALDFYAGDKQLTNAIYCNASYLFSGFDRNDIKEVSVALYAEHTLEPEQIRNARQGFNLAAEEYMRQFGIRLNVIEAELRSLPDKADPAYMKEVGNKNADINIFFTEDMPCRNGKSYGGWADKYNNTIRVHDIATNPEYMRSLLIHEIGHLFYAEHTSKEGCYMEHCFTSCPVWCDEERETIEKYKIRLW
ncbi:MAG: zinc-dependent metalloprotease family protein [Nanoarchaeota archaeon]